MRTAFEGFERRRIVIAAAVASAAIGAFSIDGVAATRHASSVPPQLVGTWTKTITAATWHKNGEYAEPAGRWAIVISKTGVTSLYQPPGRTDFDLVTTMHTTASGGSVVFGPTADGTCRDRAGYAWKVSGRKLTVKGAKDTCGPRRILLTAGSFTRK